MADNIKEHIYDWRNTLKQAEIIKQMSHKEVRQQLLLSQSIFFLLSIALSFILFDHIFDWFTLFTLDIKQIILYGILTGLALVIVEIILDRVIPQKYMDDGGINEKVFKGQSILHIFIIALVVAISEEFLFRGVIQVTFGYVFASTLFVLVHIRYLKKPFLLVAIIITSFLIGYLFEVTQNLFVPIAFHFIVDFLLGVYIKMKK